MARGGYRPGSGPKKGTKYSPRGTRRDPKQKIPKDIIDSAAAEKKTPLQYMLDRMNDPAIDDNTRDRMAIASAPFVHARKGEGAGKKEELEGKAKTAGSGKFKASTPPSLKVVVKK